MIFVWIHFIFIYDEVLCCALGSHVGRYDIFIIIASILPLDQILAVGTSDIFSSKHISILHLYSDLRRHYFRPGRGNLNSNRRLIQFDGIGCVEQHANIECMATIGRWCFHGWHIFRIKHTEQINVNALPTESQNKMTTFVLMIRWICVCVFSNKRRMDTKHEPSMCNILLKIKLETIENDCRPREGWPVYTICICPMPIIQFSTVFIRGHTICHYHQMRSERVKWMETENNNNNSEKSVRTKESSNHH